VVAPLPDRLDAVVAGYLGVDLAPAFPQFAEPVALSRLLRPGRLIEVGPLTLSLGGVVANTGLAMARFGKSVAAMGTVGQDPLGDVALSLLSEHDVALAVRRSSAGTAYGIVLALPGNDRVFLECPGCNAHYTSADVDMDVVARSRLLHFGYPPLMPALLADDGAELVSILSQARAFGIATSLDMTLPDPDGASAGVDWPSLLARVLPHVDVFTPSIEELLYMLAPAEYADMAGAAADADPVDLIGQEQYAALADAAIDLGVSVVFLKAGHRGGYLRTRTAEGLARLGLGPDWRDKALWLAPMPVEADRVHNASGAGDAAVAGFLCALLSGETPERAGAFAMLAGRDNLYGPDALGGLRTWEEMAADV